MWKINAPENVTWALHRYRRGLAFKSVKGRIAILRFQPRGGQSLWTHITMVKRTNSSGWTKGAIERSVVYVHKHDGDDVTWKQPIAEVPTQLHWFVAFSNSPAKTNGWQNLSADCQTCPWMIHLKPLLNWKAFCKVWKNEMKSWPNTRTEGILLLNCACWEKSLVWWFIQMKTMM